MPTHRLLTAAAAGALIAGFSLQAALAQTPAPSAAPPAAATPAAAAPAAAAMPAAPYKPLAVSGDTIATLRLSGEFTTFIKALDATNLSGMLQTRPSMTVFAPTDAAFAALPPGKLDALMADKAGLQKLLLHHVVNAPIPTSRFKGARGPFPSGAGDVIVLDNSADGVLKADNANIIQADVMTSNGTVQVVDQVLIAGSVPATLPEPAAEPTPDPTPAATAPAAKKPVAKKKK